MNQKEVQRLLQEVSNLRIYGEKEKMLVILHRLNNEFSNDTRYITLLATTYMNAKEDELAEEYCHKALAIDPQCPEAYEILGLLSEEKKEYEQAEIYYYKSLEKDNLFRHGHLRLMLLAYEQKKYEDTVKEAEFLLNNFNTDRNTYNGDKRWELSASWLTLVYFRLRSSLIKLKEYDKATSSIIEYIEFNNTDIEDPYFFDVEDELLYKLYYALDNKEKIKEYEDRWLNHYQISMNDIVSMQQDAKQGYIDTLNPDNYLDI